MLGIRIFFVDKITNDLYNNNNNNNNTNNNSNNINNSYSLQSWVGYKL